MGSVKIKQGTPCAKMWEKTLPQGEEYVRKGFYFNFPSVCLINNVFLFSCYVMNTVIGGNNI